MVHILVNRDDMLKKDFLSGGSQENGEKGESGVVAGAENDLWTTWSDILKNWDKRKTSNIKVEHKHSECQLFGHDYHGKP